MQPQQFQPLPQQETVPSNYLDQISAPQKPANNNKFFLILGAALIGGIVVFVLLLSLSGGSSKTVSPERLALRLQALENVAITSKDNIKSSELRSINSTLLTHLTNANRDIAEPLAAANVNLKKGDKSIATEESNKDILATLEEARLNAMFDRVYAREMAYHLKRTAILMTGLDKKSNSKSMKSFIQSNYPNLTSVEESLREFSTANNN